MPTSQATTPSHNQLDTKAEAWSALFSEPTRPERISYAVFCLKNKKKQPTVDI